MLDENHLSVLARINWGTFSMLFAADAQMENWSGFDQEGMLDRRCKVLKTAHHGSCNGTQWERLHRLRPSLVLISSSITNKDHLPDLVGTAVFAKYEVNGNTSSIVSITRDTGTVRIRVENGSYTLRRYEEEYNQNVTADLSNGGRILTRASNPTNWENLLHAKVAALYPPV